MNIVITMPLKSGSVGQRDALMEEETGDMSTEDSVVGFEVKKAMSKGT